MSIAARRSIVTLVALAVGVTGLILAWPGAASADADHTFVVDVTEDAPIGPTFNCFAGTACSLRAALEHIEQGDGGIQPPDSVEVTFSVAGPIMLNASLGSLEANYPGRITVRGPDEGDPFVIDGGGMGERLIVAGGGLLELVAMELTNGTGGAIQSTNHADIEIVDSVVSDFSADEGAAVHAHQADVSVSGSTFTDNIATSGDGGAIVATQGDVVIEDSHFERNAAEDGAGGVVHATEGPQLTGNVEITGSEIVTSQAVGGGAISARAATVEGSAIIAARSETSGGAVSVIDSLEVVDSVLEDNESIGAGGAISTHTGTVDITGSILTGNEAGGRGGVVSTRGPLTVVDSTLADNLAEDSGGAISSQDGDITIETSTLSGNETEEWHGGAVWSGEGALAVATSTISDNVAAHSGGGIYAGGAAQPGEVSVVASTIADNTATNDGQQVSTQRPMSLERTIVAGEAAGACDFGANGQVDSAGHNLASDASCGLDAEGDLEGTDPMLGPLADHGGATEVRMLLDGSPAIDAGGEACAGETDQRGVERPQGAACDIGAVEADGELGLERLSGADRVETAIAIATQSYPGGANTAVLATGNDPADSLGAAPLAVTVEGPLLLTRASQLEPAVADVLDDLGVDEVLIVGGSAAVPQGVMSDVAAEGIAVSRVSGANRFDTAAQVADEIAARVGVRDRALVAASDPGDPDVGWADALAAGSYAGIDSTPILLTATDQLPAATATRVEGMSTVEIVGGHAVVSTTVEAAIDARAGDVGRLAGANRWETAVEVADAAVGAGASAETVWVATGWNWPDGLTAGAAATVDGGVLVLVDGANLDGSAATRDWIAGHAPSTIRIAGGPVAVSDGVANSLEQLQQ